MIRNKTSSSMQKTYDECYLICSTAVYFEGQSNEAEALRSWKSALDRIYFYNAYKVPPNYVPKTETERALQESLRNMELQCRERVALLEALRDSRLEEKYASEDGKANVLEKHGKEGKPNSKSKDKDGGSSDRLAGFTPEQKEWLGKGTVPPVDYSDIPHAGPALPLRPSMPTPDSEGKGPLPGGPNILPWDHKPLTPNPPPVAGLSVRTPSPEKKSQSRMRTTLRPDGGKKAGSKPPAKKPPPGRPASAAAGLAWDAISKSAVPAGTKRGSNVNSAAAGGAADAMGIDSAGERSDRSRKSQESSSRRDSDQPPPPPPHQVPYRKRPSYQDINEARRASEATSRLVNGQGADSAPERYGRPKAPKSPVETSKPTPVYKKPELPSYRNEYPPPAPISQASISAAANPPRQPLERKLKEPPAAPMRRKPVSSTSPTAPKPPRRKKKSKSAIESDSDGDKREKRTRRKRRDTAESKTESKSGDADEDSSDSEMEGDPNSDKWEERLAYVKKNLPRGVDPTAAKQIFNDIVVQGDEVHWHHVAGLEAAKKALKEAVVYPFLRPDLFMGLREPARGMLLFGPPGTGKTMLARAVATESKSTFFAISASSLTSKWLGDSEKLVRALFMLAKALAPSIIFVDEIDSLLSARGGASEHETTRRIKTEFLIQWSDLQRAAAGEKQSEGDASRVLVLAATNTPWAIDEAARRRFVRRQYIPLPEAHVRAEQLRTLLGHQKHDLNTKDIEVLVQVTEGYSGSDMTALAKDAAMGPLRSLGEALLHMPMEKIRPISFRDFEESLMSIRPSVSKQGLKEFEDWAKEFGERGS